MAKRSREDADLDNADDRSVKQRRVAHKLSQSASKIGHAFKVARGFERQKLGRRRKNAVAKADQKDVDRIDSEIGALKV